MGRSLISSDPQVKYGKHFVSKQNYEEHFCELLMHSQGFPILVISYNDSSWADIEHILQLVSRFRSSVFVRTLDYIYKYRSSDNRQSNEYLIVAR